MMMEVGDFVVAVAIAVVVVVHMIVLEARSRKLASVHLSTD